MSQFELIQSTKKGDVVYTPDWAALDMVKHFAPSGRVLEPFKGGGVFLKFIPNAEWCEAAEGRDFFKWTEHVDWIITNPPYSILRECWRHASRVADHIVFLVPIRNFFGSDGFMRELHAWGGLPECRIYGTGTRLGFPFGNCVAAIYTQRGYRGDMRWSYAFPPGRATVSEEASR